MYEIFICMETEIWKDIPWYEGKYQASTTGKIRSVNYHREWIQRIIKTVLTHKWYFRFLLYKDWIRRNAMVHRIIALTFIQNTYGKPHVNHINGIKTDNRYENLEWCTSKENNKHAWDTWLNKVSSKNSFICGLKPMIWKFWRLHHSSKPLFSIDKLWNITMFEWTKDAERKTGIFCSQISACCRWERKTAWWYRWRYINLPLMQQSDTTKEAIIKLFEEYGN